MNWFLEPLKQLLEQSPMFALFAVIGLGYALGQVSILGFSLGVGAVLFAGLALGALAPKSAPPGLVSSIGLIMFLYGIGIQYGKEFFAGLRGPGLRWNLIAAAGVLVALAVTLALGKAAGISLAHSMGLFAGSLTNTATLQAAIDASGSRDPSVGYSASYPFGVIGPILCLFVLGRLIKPRMAPAPQPLQPIEVLLRGLTETTVADLKAQLPSGVELVAIRQDGTNRLPEAHARLACGDGVLLLGPSDALEQARDLLGSAEPGGLIGDRSNLDLVRLLVSRPSFIGMPLDQIRFPDGIAAKIAEVRRGDALLFPSPGLVLEYGDRIGVVAAPAGLPALRRHFGDSMKSTTEFSYPSVGLGMSLGVLLGMLQVPIPGVGSFSLGLAGGPLIVALVLGKLGRIGGFSWHIPLSANLTLRNFGLTLFLAAVGLSSGAPFVNTVATTGFTFLGIGAAIILSAILVIALLGQYVFKLSTDDLFGVISGAAGNPAILAYANRTLTSERIEVAYASIFPSMTIMKIICVQVAIGLLGGTAAP
jgi:putative transport protein